MAPTIAGWLLDTNVVSQLRRDRPAGPAVSAWTAATPIETCHLCTLVLAELRFGIERATSAAYGAELQRWLDDTIRPAFAGRIIPVDEDILVAWRKLSWEGQKAGYTFSPPDALIAATALVHKLGIATRNTKDFARAGVPLVDPWAG